MHPTLSGVSLEFAARLSAEDLGDIATRDIALAHLQAAVAREAKFEAARITATLARNRR